MLYLELCTIENNIFLLTNDNVFYKNLAKYDTLLTPLRDIAQAKIQSYNKRHTKGLVEACTDKSWVYMCVLMISWIQMKPQWYAGILDAEPQVSIIVYCIT